jgi:hypothetical protein
MKVFRLFPILLIAGPFYGCGPGETGEFATSDNATSHEIALEQSEFPQSTCLSSRWLSQPNGKIEAKTLSDLIKLCDDDTPHKSDS